MATPIEQRGYAHPEALVSTDWVEQHLTDPNVRLVESNDRCTVIGRASYH